MLDCLKFVVDKKLRSHLDKTKHHEEGHDCLENEMIIIVHRFGEELVPLRELTLE